MTEPVPPQLEGDLATARRLEWLTITWMLSITGVMFAVMGSSQAMKTAFIEDVLSMVPAIVMLVALRFERKDPSRKFPFGYDRVHSLAFVVAAVALTSVGAVLLLESAVTLAKREHVTIGSVFLFGQQIWLGWLMIAALAYSVVPPFILGRMKLPVAQRLNDAVLHTDAQMQKADWMTGLAGIGGILGLGFGLWWADAAAALLIAFSILHDGLTALRIAAAELMDGTPRALGKDEVAPDAAELERELQRRWPDARIRLRESGRYIVAQVHGVVSPPESIDLRALWPGDPERHWRLAELNFAPPEAGER